MLVFAYLPRFDNYKDRYGMFAAMCELGAEVRIFLGHGEHPADFSPPDRFVQLPVTSGQGVLARRKHIGQHLADLPSDRRVILHDTFIAQMAMQIRNRWTWRRRRPNVRNVLSLYSPSAAFLLEGRWRGIDREFRTTLKEWPYYLKKQIPVVLSEFLSSRAVDCVVGNSEEIVRSVSKYYRIPPPRCRCISACIDTKHYTPGPPVPAGLNIPANARTILFVGKFQRLKGITTLLRAFDLAAEQIKGLRLIMVGRPGDTEFAWFQPLIDSLKHRDGIDIREPVGSDRLLDFYRTCDVFVLPSHHEGSPRVVKEALACGCPVIASRIPGSEIIDPGEESIVFAPDYSPRTYADLIVRMLSDDSYRRQRVEAGLEVVRRLNPFAVARQYMELYESLF
jgi:glycosyltransferase involved in cell wall biosynthesis